MQHVADLLIDPDFCTDLTILRRTETLIKGRAQITTVEEAAIGVVHPAPGKELERLPEADRDKETLVIYTQKPLGVGADAAGGPQKADAVCFLGSVYTVVSVEAWPLYGFVKALCQKEGAGGGA